MTPQQRLARKKAAKASSGGRATRDDVRQDSPPYRNTNPNVYLVPDIKRDTWYSVSPYGASPMRGRSQSPTRV
jgi:hypothetical protein